MRKCLVSDRARPAVLLLSLLATLYSQQVTAAPAAGADAASTLPGIPSSAVTDPSVQRAASNVDRMRALVAQGALPKNKLDEALRELDDARDQDILGRTLYGAARIQDLSPQDAAGMVAASERRVERQRLTVDERSRLVDAGVLARVEIAPQVQELEARQRTLDLARGRKALVEQLAAMVRAEEEFEQARLAALPASPKETMFRFEGSGDFHLEQLPKLERAYEDQFHSALPVSAIGQTALHDALGFDHRNRVDVAVNPDQKEGLWLRAMLERLRIPYIAFRDAVAGSATAPHIHIGPGSQRVHTAAVR